MVLLKLVILIESAVSISKGNQNAYSENTLDGFSLNEITSAKRIEVSRSRVNISTHFCLYN